MKHSRANERLENLQRQSRSEIAKMQAMLRKAEMRVTSLENTVTQKQKDNEELAIICDELIAKVGK